MNIKLFLTVLAPIFLLSPVRGYAQEEASPTDEIVVKAVDAEMFQIKANMKLTDDQASALASIVTDTIVKVRNLQLSLENGNIDGKTMYTQRAQVINDQNEAFSRIIGPDQMKIWLNMQQYQ